MDVVNLENTRQQHEPCSKPAGDPVFVDLLESDDEKPSTRPTKSPKKKRQNSGRQVVLTISKDLGCSSDEELLSLRRKTKSAVDTSFGKAKAANQVLVDRNRIPTSESHLTTSIDSPGILDRNSAKSLQNSIVVPQKFNLDSPLNESKSTVHKGMNEDSKGLAWNKSPEDAKPAIKAAAGRRIAEVNATASSGILADSRTWARNKELGIPNTINSTAAQRKRVSKANSSIPCRILADSRTWARNKELGIPNIINAAPMQGIATPIMVTKTPKGKSGIKKTVAFGASMAPVPNIGASPVVGSTLYTPSYLQKALEGTASLRNETLQSTNSMQQRSFSLNYSSDEQESQEQEESAIPASLVTVTPSQNSQASSKQVSFQVQSSQRSLVDNFERLNSGLNFNYDFNDDALQIDSEDDHSEIAEQKKSDQKNESIIDVDQGVLSWEGCIIEESTNKSNFNDEVDLTNDDGGMEWEGCSVAQEITKRKDLDRMIVEPAIPIHIDIISSQESESSFAVDVDDHSLLEACEPMMLSTIAVPGPSLISNTILQNQIDSGPVAPKSIEHVLQSFRDIQESIPQLPKKTRAKKAKSFNVAPEVQSEVTGLLVDAKSIKEANMKKKIEESVKEITVELSKPFETLLMADAEFKERLIELGTSFVINQDYKDFKIRWIRDKRYHFDESQELWIPCTPKKVHEPFTLYLYSAEEFATLISKNQLNEMFEKDVQEYPDTTFIYAVYGCKQFHRKRTTGLQREVDVTIRSLLDDSSRASKSKAAKFFPDGPDEDQFTAALIELNILANGKCKIFTVDKKELPLWVASFTRQIGKLPREL